MADKRELELEVKVDDKASRPLKKIGDQADKTATDFEEMNLGLKKLDEKVSDTTKTIGDLRQEVARTGDLNLIKDIGKQEQRLKALAKQRKILLGDQKKTEVVEEILPDPAQVGVSVGARIGPFLIQGLSRAVAGVGPAAAVGAPLLAGVAAFVGGTAAGGILAQGVVAAVSSGIRIAAQDTRVKIAGKQLGDDLLGQLEEAAGAFVPATLQAMDIVRAEVKTLQPELQGIFDAAAGYVRPLTLGITGLVKNALPGLRKGIQAAGPVVDSISRGLPRIGKAVGDIFGDLADNAAEAAEALDITFGIITTGIRIVGGLVNVLAESYGWLDKISAVMTGDWGHFAEIINRQDQAKHGATELGAAWRALSQADPGTEALWQRQILLNKSMADGIKQAGGLKQALDLLNGGALSAREAERSYQEAIDAVTASIKENGKTLNINTEQGRANQATLDALASAGSNRAQSIYEQTLATKGQAAAEGAATAAYQQGREQLIRSAIQMGMTKEAAKALADEIMAIPQQWTTRVGLVGAESAIARANAVQAAIKRITGKDIRIGVTGGRGGNLEGMSDGGPVMGPGPKGIDSRPKLLAPGEHVLTAREVDAAGGHSAVEAWRKSLLSGPSRSASATTARQSRTVRAELEVAGEREIVALLRRLIKQYRLVEV